MKKNSILLSSLCILSACGGGSGGSGVAIPNKPDTPFVPQEDTIASSNAKITNMISNSEYQVTLFVSNKLGADAESVGLGNITGRGATTRGAFLSSHSGELDYDKAAELVNMATWLNQPDTSAEDIIAEFNNDRNKIKAALKLMDDMYCFVGGDASETARRILEMRDKNSFDAPLETLKSNTEVMNLKDVMFNTTAAGRITRLKFNVDDTGKIVSLEYPDAQQIMDEAAGLENDYTEITIGPIPRVPDTDTFVEKIEHEGQIFSFPRKYISYARELGLKYSDFGVLESDLRDAGGDWGISFDPFAGGYETKEIDANRMTELAQNGEIIFNGLARGDVTYFWCDGPCNDENHYEPSIEGGLRDDNATLVFSPDGKQTLSANFTNWYNIQAIHNADGTNQFKIIGGDGGNDKRFHLNTDPNAPLLSDNGSLTNNGVTYERMNMYVGYYGKDNEPSEAVGLVKYQFTPSLKTIEDETGVGTHWEPDPNGNVSVSLGFGGKRN